MEVNKFKKIGKSKYKVSLDNGEITLYEEVILKYNLLTRKKLNLSTLNKILEDNKYYEMYNLALNYIGIKMRNKEEIKNYLLKKDYSLEETETVIDKLTKEGYLNDIKYIEAYINDKLALSTDGPFKIKQSLLNYKLDEEDIDALINKIDSNIWLDKIQKILEKKKKLNKNLSENAFKYKMKSYLYNLGYEDELINSQLSDIKLDNNSIKKEYEKAYKKYSKKYTADKLNYYIRNYLYQKQYSVEEINDIMNQ